MVPKEAAKSMMALKSASRVFHTDVAVSMHD